MNIETKTYNGRLDALGMGVSVVCAVHCVIFPLLFSTLPFLGIEILHNIVLETITVLLSAVVGCLALLAGFKKHHHKLLPVVLFTASMMIVVIANFQNAKTEIALKLIAVPGIITAHILNWYYSRFCGNHRHS